MKTILEIQSEIEMALCSLRSLAGQLPDVLKPLLRLAPPEGSRAEVSLCHPNKNGKNRQIKRNAPWHAWSSDSDLISISYKELADEATQIEERQITQPEPAPRVPVVTEDPARDLVLALGKAEQDPQLGFISLKWFRDTYLSRQGYGWANAEQNRQRVLENAIDRNWILTSKVPNPKNPRYPVTAIRVNRSIPELRDLVNQQLGLGVGFVPITISGERLSETVLRERR